LRFCHAQIADVSFRLRSKSVTRFVSRADVQIRMLGPDDGPILARVASDVFDGPIVTALGDEFLADPRHHLAVAIADGKVVGFVSAVHYVHPDKRAQLFVNEVSVATAWRRQRIASRLLDAILARGRALGCGEAWVGTETGNVAARALYKSAHGIEDPEPFVMFTFPLDRPGGSDG
jgi:ribosomal protein S18 acetylase RimI-like enzyme